MSSRTTLPVVAGAALVVGLTVGAVVGAVVAGAVLPPPSTSSPTTSLTTATGCYPAEETPRPSWVGQVPAGDEGIVVFNHTLVHESPGLDVRSDLVEPEPGRYVFRLSTAPTTEKPQAGGCEPRTHLTAVVSLPAPSDSLTVELDGRRLVAVEDAGSSPQFRSVNASADGGES